MALSEDLLAEQVEEKILKEVVRPLTGLLDDGVIDKWFFIRYRDSDTQPSA